MYSNQESIELSVSEIDWQSKEDADRALGQYRLLRSNGVSIAYAGWPDASQEVDTRFEAGNLRLWVGDWASGSQWWLIVFVVPANEAEAVFMDQVFKDREIKMLRLKEQP